MPCGWTKWVGLATFVTPIRLLGADYQRLSRSCDIRAGVEEASRQARRSRSPDQRPKLMRIADWVWEAWDRQAVKKTIKKSAKVLSLLSFPPEIGSRLV